jgi:hypothetical protein
MLKLKLKLVGANALTCIYEATGTPEAIAQYIADQADVVSAKTGKQGATISESGAPLVFRKSAILEEITRNENGWYSDNSESKAVAVEIVALQKAGNDTLANFLLAEQAKELYAKIKASAQVLKNRPAYVKPATTAGLGNV